MSPSDVIEGFFPSALMKGIAAMVLDGVKRIRLARLQGVLVGALCGLGNLAF